MLPVPDSELHKACVAESILHKLGQSIPPTAKTLPRELQDTGRFLHRVAAPQGGLSTVAPPSKMQEQSPQNLRFAAVIVKCPVES